MNFYNLLSAYYSLIFPLPQTTKQFLQKQLPNQRLRALDIGCGIGDTGNFLSESFQYVQGIDVSESMVEMAKHRKIINSDYDVVDMRDLGLFAQPQTYDFVTCMGNTLVHVPQDEVLKVLVNVREILRLGGRFVIQILNYDLILDQKITELPLINHPEVEFKRSYPLENLSEHSVMFVSDITDKKTKQKYTSSTTLFPIRKEKLLQLLEEAGLEVDGVYGSFDMQPNQIQSIALILTGSRLK